MVRTHYYLFFLFLLNELVYLFQIKVRQHIMKVYINNIYISCIFIMLIISIRYDYFIPFYFIKIILLVYLVTIFYHNISNLLCKEDYDLTLKIVRFIMVLITHFCFIILITSNIVPSLGILKLFIISLLCLVIFLLFKYRYNFINSIDIEYIGKYFYGIDIYLRVFNKKKYIFLISLMSIIYLAVLL